jgi:CRISPR-associated protein Cas1
LPRPLALFSVEPLESFSRRSPCSASVNAILNYAYAALESEIRIKTISEGYDPTIGIMHEGSDGSSKLIFDLAEPERPKVDRAVLGFVTAHVFDPADFVIRTDGVCRLIPKALLADS